MRVTGIAQVRGRRKRRARKKVRTGKKKEREMRKESSLRRSFASSPVVAVVVVDVQSQCRCTKRVDGGELQRGLSSKHLSPLALPPWSSGCSLKSLYIISEGFAPRPDLLSYRGAFHLLRPPARFSAGKMSSDGGRGQSAIRSCARMRIPTRGIRLWHVLVHTCVHTHIKWEFIINIIIISRRPLSMRVVGNLSSA